MQMSTENFHFIPALDGGIFKTDDLVTSMLRECTSRVLFHVEHESHQREKA